MRKKNFFLDFFSFYFRLLKGKRFILKNSFEILFLLFHVFGFNIIFQCISSINVLPFSKSANNCVFGMPGVPTTNKF